MEDIQESKSEISEVERGPDPKSFLECTAFRKDRAWYIKYLIHRKTVHLNQRNRQWDIVVLTWRLHGVHAEMM